MSIKELITNTLELPRDVVMDLPAIKAVGNGELFIENHSGIVEYTKDVLRIKTSIGIIKIIGTGLVIGEISREELYIKGSIASIIFKS